MGISYKLQATSFGIVKHGYLPTRAQASLIAQIYFDGNKVGSPQRHAGIRLRVWVFYALKLGEDKHVDAYPN